jgi:signal transduction histidine kinase
MKSLNISVGGAGDQGVDLTAQKVVVFSVVMVGFLAAAATGYEYYHLEVTARHGLYTRIVIPLLAVFLTVVVSAVLIFGGRLLRPAVWSIFAAGSGHLLTIISIALLVDNDIALAAQHALWIMAVQVCLFATLDRRIALSLSTALFALLTTIFLVFAYAEGVNLLSDVRGGSLVQLMLSNAAVLVLLGGLSSFRELALVETARASASEDNALLLKASADAANAERKTAVQALGKAEAASRAREAFLASMSHELRTPLNAIIGFSQILEMGDRGIAGEPEKRQEYVSDIRHSGEHMLSLVTQILEYSRLESEGSDLTVANHAVEELAESAMRMVDVLANAKQVRLSRQWDEEQSFEIETDERALNQILLNLLSNAVKFTPEGGCISLTIEMDTSSGVSIGIQDNGIGIPQDKIAHVCDPFFQAGDQRNTGAEGTGLGLSIVTTLVRDLGGTFEIKSEIGKGTRCRVRLPFKAERVESSHSAIEETSPSVATG